MRILKIRNSKDVSEAVVALSLDELTHLDNAVVSAEIVLRNSGGEGVGYEVLHNISLKLHDIFNTIAEDELSDKELILSEWDDIEEAVRQRNFRQQR